MGFRPFTTECSTEVTMRVGSSTYDYYITERIVRRRLSEVSTDSFATFCATSRLLPPPPVPKPLPPVVEHRRAVQEPRVRGHGAPLPRHEPRS